MKLVLRCRLNFLHAIYVPSELPVALKREAAFLSVFFRVLVFDLELLSVEGRFFTCVNMAWRSAVQILSGVIWSFRIFLTIN